MGDNEFLTCVIDVLNGFSSEGEIEYAGDLIEKFESQAYEEPQVQAWIDSLISNDIGYAFLLLRYVEELEYYVIDCTADTVAEYIAANGAGEINLESGYYDFKENRERVKSGREYGEYGTYRDYKPKYSGDFCFDHYTGYGIESSWDLTSVDLNDYVIYYKGVILDDAEKLMKDAIYGSIDFEDCVTLSGRFLFVENEYYGPYIYVYDTYDTFRSYPIVIEK